MASNTHGIAFPLRKTVIFLALFVAIITAFVQAGCGDTGGSAFDPNGSSGTSSGTSSGDIPPGFNPGDGDGAASSSGNGDASGTLDVTPGAATVTVTITNGVVNAPPQTFVASYAGQQVAATWLLDRGELGDINASGVFTASGANVGDGIITARYGSREGTAKIKVIVAATQNGAPTGLDAGGGSGGIGGVGGEPLGAAVPNDVVTKLKVQTNLPGTPAELGFLYPYDQTVWPRGLLPPLLMWQTSRDASAVYVKLSQGNYTFEGTYLVSQFAANSIQKERVRLEETAWKTATQGNAGDDLKLEVKIYQPSNDTVYGPITRTWKVAPGVLKGTVYYNSYDSQLTAGGGVETGGVIKIKPRSPNPELALPAMAGKCHVCHSVSADGSTLWANDSDGPAGTETEYSNGASYDLGNNNTRTTYKAVGAGGNIVNDHKFTWSAPYPDGAFALASSRFAREAYIQGNSKLFARADGSEIASTGLNGVVDSAVTPAFSPDGKKVAFNFWTGPGGGGVTAGNGHSLSVLDFSCGAAAGSTKCAVNGPFAFAGLREIYRNANTFPSWTTFVPDGKAVVFNNQTAVGNCGPNPPDPNSIRNCQISTWYSGKSEIWIARDGTTPNARRLDNANGVGLPTNADHPDDSVVNYQPTVNPVASGGYYWVVFTSRRIYGNLIDGSSWGGGAGGGPIKKLWVAAIDINNPNAAADPSHPAFYLPGQEIDAGNTRGFWVVDPCKANGLSCETGDECCNGFCRKDPDGGALVCGDKPPGNPCSQEFEKCTVNADCCDPSYQCIAGKCSRPDPVVK